MEAMERLDYEVQNTLGKKAILASEILTKYSTRANRYPVKNAGCFTVYSHVYIPFLG
jgi:hypothetical protein